MSSLNASIYLILTCLIVLVPSSVGDVVEHPLNGSERRRIAEELGRQLDALPILNDDDPDGVRRHSRRGDVLFFMGKYAEAVEEYRAMVRLDPKLDASHWRLGIALFFAEEYEAAAGQFDRYHSFDDVDRENGIWRFLSHYRAFGKQRAAQQLLKYSKDDREPFPVVYRLFDGGITPADALAGISDDLPATERSKRLFYTQLYIGMLETVRGNTRAAQVALADAVARTWPRKAGFGPHFMWHVGRLQFEQLTESREPPLAQPVR